MHAHCENSLFTYWEFFHDVLLSPDLFKFKKIFKEYHLSVK